MKQTKKLTRNQREFLVKCGVKDTTIYRLVEETKEKIVVINTRRGNLKEFFK